jgi:hypothetical protein
MGVTERQVYRGIDIALRTETVRPAPSQIDEGIAVTLNLHGLDFDAACARLESNGCTRIAEGDWAYVYEAPDASSVVRLTPYDPAYLGFVHTCWSFPHRNLPAYYAVVHLTGPGYAVEMPRYVAGDLARRAAFLAALQSAMVSEHDERELAALSQTLKRGIAAGHALVPYFAGMDWNVENVLLDGATPKVVDGFAQAGETITAGIAQGTPLQLSPVDIASFLAIPFHRRVQKPVGE